MMKMTRLSLFPLLQAAGLALLLCACTSESTDEGLPEGTKPIRFQMPETRGVVNGAGDMEAFSVWGGYDNDATNVFNGTEVRNESNAWTYTGTQYWIAEKNYDFYAVYPTGVSANVSDDGTITISDFDASATGEKAVDLMTASALNMKGSSPRTVAFTFGHELSRIIVEVRPDPGITVSNINATLSGFSTTGTLTRTSSGASSWTLNETAGSSKAEAENTENSLFDLLLIPQSTSGVQLKISLDRQQSDDTSSTSLNTTLPLTEPTQWSAGRTYRYTIRIQVDAITFSDFTVDEWGVTHTGGDINIGPSTSSN